MRKWTLTPFFPLAPYSKGCVCRLMTVLCALALGGCAEEPPEITRPNNRIQHFLAKQFHRMTSQQKYQEFIETEIGSGFTENDFAYYMEKNEAECEVDSPPYAGVYCMYIDFKVIYAIRRHMKYYTVFCFWVHPSQGREVARFRQVHGASLKEFPTVRRQFSKTMNIPGCKTLLENSGGIGNG